MSAILDLVDDGEEPSGASWTLIGADGFRATVRDVVLTTTGTGPWTPQEERDARLYFEPFTLEMSFPLAEPTPVMGYWERAAFGRTICAAFGIRLRDIGVMPRYGFDARYRQRQKNRVKRRR